MHIQREVPHIIDAYALDSDSINPSMWEGGLSLIHDDESIVGDSSVQFNELNMEVNWKIPTSGKGSFMLKIYPITSFTSLTKPYQTADLHKSHANTNCRTSIL